MPNNNSTELNLERQAIGFDPFFTDRFFDLGKNLTQSLIPTLDVMVPPTDELNVFFNSHEGRAYKQQFSEALDVLIAWCEQNNITAQNLQWFKKTYLDYSGLDPEKNKLYLPLYQQGIFSFTGIAYCLTHYSQKLPLDFSKTVMNNLLEKFKVCSPAIYTNTYDAYLKMHSYVSLAMRCMEARREISKQVILDLLKPYSVLEVTEIHYVNGVLNFFAKLLGFEMIQDDCVNDPVVCNPITLESVREQFKKVIATKLTPSMFFNYIVNYDLNLDRLLADLNDPKKNYIDTVTEFENKIFPHDQHQGAHFYSIDKIIYIGSNDSHQYLTYQANEIATLSVMGGMLHQNLLDQKKFSLFSLTEEEAYIAYLQNDANIDCMYVYNPHINDHLHYLPFSSYYIQNLLTCASLDRDLLINFVATRLTYSQKSSLAKKIIQYLNSHEYLESENQKNQHMLLMQQIFSFLEIDEVKLFPVFTWNDLLDCFTQYAKSQKFFILIAKAIVYNKIDLLKKFLDYIYKNSNDYSDMAKIKYYLSRTLANAARDGYLAAIKVVLQTEYKTEINTRINFFVKGCISAYKNIDVISIAAFYGHLALVEELIKNGATIHVEHARQIMPGYLPPLWYAILNNQYDVVKFLLAEGALPNQAFIADRFIPIIEVIRHNQVDIFKLLLADPRFCLNTSISSDVGTTPFNANQAYYDDPNILFTAVRLNQPEILQLLIEKAILQNWQGNQAEPIIELYNARTAHGNTLMHIALQTNSHATVELLLAKNIAIHHANDFGHTPLIYAIQNNNVALVKKLLEANVNINQADDTYQAPLIYAIKSKNKEMVQLLLEKGAEINKTTQQNLWPIAVAFELGDFEIAKLLLNDDSIDIERPLVGAERNSLIMYAIKKNQYEILEMLINKISSERLKTEINRVNKSKYSALHYAARLGNLAIVDLLLLNHAQIHKRDVLNSTALLIAVQYGHLEVVQRLVKAKAKVNVVNLLCQSPLSEAITVGNVAIFDFLYRLKNAYPDVGLDAVSPLLMAIKNSHLRMLTVLLNNPEVREKEIYLLDKEENAFLLACANNRFDILQMLISKAQDKEKLKLALNAKNALGLTPLMLASRADKADVVDTLLLHGAETDHAVISGSALHFAAFNGNLTIVKMLIAAGCLVDLATKKGITPLIAAVLGGSLPVVVELLTNKSSVNGIHQSQDSAMIDKYPHFPIVYAINRSKVDIVLHLLNDPAIDIESPRDICGNSLILLACKKNHMSILKILIEKIAENTRAYSINMANYEGKTPLMYAVDHQNLDMIELLLLHGAEINAVDKKQNCALMSAIKNGAGINLVKKLIESGADIHYIYPATGESALHCAVHANDLEVFNYLIKNGIDLKYVIAMNTALFDCVFACNRLNFVPVILQETGFAIESPFFNASYAMLFAAKVGHVDVVNFLLEHKVNPDISDERHSSALAIACQNGCFYVAKCLIENNAQINLENDDKKTPLILAIEAGHAWVTSLLLSKKAEINRGAVPAILSAIYALEKNPNKKQEAIITQLLNDERLDVDNLHFEVRLNKVGLKATLSYSAKSHLIHWVIEQGNVNYLKLIIKRSKNLLQLLTTKDHDLNTPLMLAAKSGRIELVVTLLSPCVLDSKALNDFNRQHETAVFIAAEHGYMNIIRKLVEAGARIDFGTEIKVYGKNFKTPLYVAIKNKNVEVAKYLLYKGAECNTLHNTVKHVSYLIFIIKNADIYSKGNVEIVRLFLSKVMPCEKMAMLNAQDQSGKTALMLAAENGYADLFDLLVQSGADVNQSTKDGMSALSYAATYGRLEMVKKLIAKGAACNPIDIQTEENPLLKAIAGNHVAVVKFLVTYNDHQNNQSLVTTPLIYAITENFNKKNREARLLIIEVLLDAKSFDVNSLFESQPSFMDCLTRIKDLEILDLLRRKTNNAKIAFLDEHHNKKTFNQSADLTQLITVKKTPTISNLPFTLFTPNQMIGNIHVMTSTKNIREKNQIGPEIKNKKIKISECIGENKRASDRKRKYSKI